MATTPEQQAKYFAQYRERNREKRNARARAKRAALAEAEGRKIKSPGSGKPVSEKRKEQKRLAQQRWRDRNRAAVREIDSAYQRDLRRALALADGRTPGVKGSERKFTDEQRRQRRNLWSLEWRKSNPELAKAYVKAWKVANPDVVRAASKARHARHKGASGRFKFSDIVRLFDLQKGKCSVCLKPFDGKKFEIDHYLPIKLGGTNDPRNLRLLHMSCNRSKHARHPIDHALSLGLLCW